MPRHVLSFIGLILLAFTFGCGPEPVQTETPEPEVGETTPAPETPVASDEKKSPDADTASQVPYENPLTAEEQQAGWLTLFDGHSLFGWESNNEEVNWHVADGAITADSGPTGLLVTHVPFADYELRVQFRMEAAGNSGVFLRTTKQPKEVTADCYELNIVDDHPSGFLTGSFVGRQKTEAPISGSGDWKTFRVLAQGRRFEVFLDDQPILDYSDETDSFRPTGLIGLQKNAGKIEFRDIRLKPLSLDPLFNGEDLTGWHTVPGSKSEFSVVDGAIHVVNGQGFLETDQTYGDFILQAESETHAERLNSGYFFRLNKGTEEAPSNGYEVQIDNGFDGDRHHPSNQGSGAIFRPGIPARYVVANDNEWFTTTLVASGPRMMTWVNGYPVLAWEDTRKPDENPRRGLRTAAGHISLQGHDPTTDVSFRNLRIKELP
ncbi:MAG: DUF1080 domain-containing protein [Planctomycetaceae bacterium]|nr:DUF1080 domain-containing protein [Planctomycetaceae bacterium]MCB9949659.1 DUF1080 domain-containing protein [Planctomycetaceae bacterium]